MNAQYQIKLQPDFIIGNLATDLVELTIQYCTKYENTPPRFPKRMYDSYVTHIVNLSLMIHLNIHEANSVRKSKEERYRLQNKAVGECSSMEKLIYIAFKRGWISNKQHSKWQRLICNLHFRILNWMDSV